MHVKFVIQLTLYSSLHLMTRQLLFGGKVLMVSIKNGRRISSLRAFGPGGGQIWRVVHVSARAPFGVLGENRCLAYAKQYFWGKTSTWLTRNDTF